MRIVLADENVVYRKKIRRILETLGYSIIGEARNGLHVFHKYVELNPDLLIMSLNMTMYDGLSTVKRIIDYDIQAKIVVMIEPGENKKAFEAMACGAIHYLTLPADKHQVELLMQDVVRILE